MVNSSHTISLLKKSLKDVQLVYKAKSGNSLAFIDLYNAHVESIYRYVYFLVPSNKVAEGIALQVFFKAWELLDQHQILEASISTWLYALANDRIGVYYSTHKEVIEPDNDFTMAIKGAGFREEFQIVRDGLRLLPVEQQQILVLKFIAGMSNKQIGNVLKTCACDIRVLQLQGLQKLAEYLSETESRLVEDEKFQGIAEKALKRFTMSEISPEKYLARYPEYSDRISILLEAASMLNLGRETSPTPGFVKYAHDALMQYIWFHPRHSKVIITPIFQRTVFTFAMLTAIFLITGTVRAQSALPGDAFYVWKRASERAWLILSPDPVATDITLAERRLSEWIAVSNNSTLNTRARFYYLEALTQLESKTDLESLPQVLPVLQLQQQALGNAGLVVRELDNYLFQAALIVEIGPSVQNTPTSIVATTMLTSVPTQIAATQTEAPTETVATETAVPTEVVPTETTAPTEVTPTKTTIPTTEVVPTESATPTEIVPTEAATPTEVVPTETPAPTEVVPTETPAPTEVVPTEPPAPTATESRTESLSNTAP